MRSRRHLARVHEAERKRLQAHLGALLAPCGKRVHVGPWARRGREVWFPVHLYSPGTRPHHAHPSWTGTSADVQAAARAWVLGILRLASSAAHQRAQEAQAAIETAHQRAVAEHAAAVQLAERLDAAVAALVEPPQGAPAAP